MNITSVNTFAASYSTANNKTNNKMENNDASIKQLTNEVNSTGADEVHLSREAIDLSVAHLGGLKSLNLPKSTVRMVDLQIKLMQEMKTQKLAGQGTGDNIKDLANAYAVVSSNLNENSVNSQKHSKFLDDAFKGISNLFFTRNAEQEVRNDYFDEELQGNTSDIDLNNLMNKAAADAKKQSSIFSDAFLKNFKKLGLDKAFDLAISLL